MENISEVENLKTQKQIEMENYGISREDPEVAGEESMSPLNQLEEIYPLENINIDPNYFSIYELKRKYDRTKKQSDKEGDHYVIQDKRNQIVLNSDFQREAVWGIKQKSELIESVLMGLPIPVMYLFEDKFANLIVVDGRQRLTAFFEFLDNKYPLKVLKVLKNINGKFKDLDPIYQSKLEDYQLITQVIKPPTPDAIKFQIFDRVNRGGTPLNNQEMRNALYQGNSTKLLDRISKSNEFKEATYNGLKSKRMKDKYIILRSVAFYLWATQKLVDIKGSFIEYKGDIDDFLGKTMEFLNITQESTLIDLENKFKVAMLNAKRILGVNAFRLASMEDTRKLPINMNVFEIVVFIMITLDNNTILDKVIAEKYYKMISNEKFQDNIANHRDSVSKVNQRFNWITKSFIEVIKNDK